MSQLRHLPTPCFILDETEFRRGIDGFRQALQTHFQHVCIGYSVKTNSLPYALRLAGELGCYAEVVSHDEYRLARLCGYTPDRIIYNGPMKLEETFLEAVAGGAVVNIEAAREIQWLRQLPADRQYNIGLRLNINISHISPQDADGDDDNSRFGFSDQSGAFAEALEQLREIPNIRIAGLHIHRTAHSRAPRFYERSVDYAAQIIRKYNLRPDYLDIGGGYFGIFPEKPTFADYADTFHKALLRHKLENLRIIVEPGNALTASAFSFLTEIIDVKRVDTDTRFATIDGSRNDIDPFFRKNGYLMQLLTADTDRPSEPQQIIAGCTCLEYDRLLTLQNAPRLQPGDRIRFNNVGAYTMTLSPQFIRLWPAVYAISSEGTPKEIRRRAEAADITALDS